MTTQTAQPMPVLEAIRNICDHLVERTATLFLGAGVNAGLCDPAGQRCPLGNDLSTMICTELLGSPETHVPLDEAAEMARYALGEKALNDFIFKVLDRFQPGSAHLALVQLPWDVIYTTNYDLLVEKAGRDKSIKTAGTIRGIVSSSTSLTSFIESDILYYKLHGSAELANTKDGRLILTKSDYRFYEEYKKPLFRRLRSDLLGKTFVFVGYSLSDPNFRGILEDCRQELGVQTLPLSYAVQHEFTDLQAAFWREKYNVQLIRSDATEFLVTLKDTWVAENCQVVPFLQRKAVEYLHVDNGTRFQKVGDSFYLLRPADCTGSSNPSAFFKGCEPSWADIRDNIAPHRDIYDDVLEAVFPELVDPTIGPSAFLVTGAAGTGKTALLRSLAFDITAGFGNPTFIHIPGTPLDARTLTPLMNPERPERFIVMVHFAAEYMRELGLFWEELRQKKLPVTLLLEERKNQWLVSKTSVPTQFNPTEFELATLSQGEEVKILDALEKYGCLGKLTGVSRDDQLAHFSSLAHEDLLVALRELTEDTRFDKIVEDEYSKIPSSVAQQAYVYVAAVGQLDLSLRYETLIRIMGLQYSQLRPDILVPTEGILLTGEETGSSRHNIGFRLRARHPIIASMIFALAAPDDGRKFEVLNSILTHLDPGFREDLRLLKEIVRRKELVNTFAEHAMRRALYDRIAAVLPGDPYVLQHRSIVEREMKDPQQAVHFARLAVKQDPRNAAFQNTLGFALELAARDVEDQIKRSALLSEADKLFADGIARDRSDPYGYLGKLAILRQHIDRESDRDKRDEMLISALSLSEEAFEATGESPLISAELAKLREQLVSLENAIDVVRRAVRRHPADSRLRQLLVKFEEELGDPRQALKEAMEAAKADPTSWRVQRSIARLRRRLGENVQSVRGYYEAAIRHHKGDVSLVVEYGAYLFTSGFYNEAHAQFDTVRNLTISSADRNRVREVWRQSDNKVRVFEGKVSRIAGAKGSVVAVPENFEAFFWRATGTSLLREGDDITFTIGFNSLGAIARTIKPLC